MVQTKKGKNYLYQTIWSFCLKTNNLLCLSQKRTMKGQSSKYELKLTRKRNNETVTKAICNKGFSGYSSVLPRISFCNGRQGRSPQSLTFHTRNRYRAFYNDLMYKANTRMVDIALDSKAYIKSAFGATSPQYKQVSKLKFTSTR